MTTDMGDGMWIGQKAGEYIAQSLSEMATSLSVLDVKISGDVVDEYAAQRGLTYLGDSFQSGCAEIKAGLESLATAIEKMSQWRNRGARNRTSISTEACY